MYTGLSSTSASEPFLEARARALVAGLIDQVRRRPSDLLAFDLVRVSVNIRGQHALGRQSVPVTLIVGSEGRTRDFDRRFLPRTDRVKQRWDSIEQAMRRGLQLPPIDLYKLGEVYFVRDGNHRVSVARQIGQAEIDADVTELLVDVAITSALSVRTLLLTQEYSDFLEWTNLHELRPDERIVFSELGGYLDLVRQINAHRRNLAHSRGGPVTRDEAVASWYDTLYMPAICAIRQRRLPRGRTEADLYRHAMLSACN